jgi:hypothetical protein
MTTHIDEATGEILESDQGAALAAPATGSGIDLADAPLTWQALVRISDTEFVPSGLRGKPDAVLAAVFTGREIGLDPIASLRLIDVIDGRPSLSAELTVALVRAAGHRVSLVEETPVACTVEGVRGGQVDDRMTVTYSLEDAQRAGLVTRDDHGVPRARSRNGKALPWETYTADLLWARAVSRLARRLFPDVLAAPTRTAVATFTTEAVTETAEDAAYALGALLEEPIPATGVDAEVYLRRVCRLAVASEIVSVDPLPGILAGFGAVHVAGLKAAEIRNAAESARTSIGGAYSDAVGRRIETRDLVEIEEY